MTLPRLYALNNYWMDHPPIHVLVAAYLGAGADKPKKARTMDEMIADFSGMGFEVQNG